MKVVMPGGSGHVGQALRRFFEDEGWEFVVLTRNPRKINDVRWDGMSLGPWINELDGADVVVNLAGRSVNCRYGRANLEEMLTSRVNSVNVLASAINLVDSPPLVWLQASTATIYAHRLDAANDEETGILGGGEPGATPKWNASIEIAKAWEGAFNRAHTPATRKVAMRSAMTMGPQNGSVFDVLTKLAKRGLGGSAGSGEQYVSWIHEYDFCQAVRFLMEHKEISGAINVCSPNPLPNKEFVRVLRDNLGVRLALPTPSWVLEIGAWLMQTETELVLKSRRVVPERLLEAGFHFKFPEWPVACADLVAKRFGSGPSGPVLNSSADQGSS